MSNAISHAEDSAHAGPIKNPRQFIFTVLAAFVLPIFIVIGLVFLVTYQFKPSGLNTESSRALNGVTEQSAEQSMMARLQKVGMVEIRDANRPLKAGEEVYKAQCSACHAAGVAGAPKFGDAGAWAPRIPHGYEVLLTSALKGKGAMGPQGGGDFEDVEIGRAVVYMTNAAGGNLPVPQKAGAAVEAPAAGAPAVQAATPAAPVSAVLAAAAPAVPAQAASTPSALTAVAAATATALASDVPATTTAAPANGTAVTPAATPSATTLAATTQTAATSPATPTSAAAPAAAAAVAAVAPVPVVASANAAAGAALYKSVCFACHAAGVAGAPKFGDKAAWAPHIAEGLPAMVAAVKKGKGAMPPRGGSTASDADLQAAVEYMVSAAK